LTEIEPSEDDVSSKEYAGLLEDAADRITDISHAGLQIILRRAALRLRNGNSVVLDWDVEAAVGTVANELGKTRNDMLRFIVREWLETNGYLPVHMLDEDGEVEGNA
jgi:hypothetical protein